MFELKGRATRERSKQGGQSIGPWQGASCDA